ncbi:MAG TPA: hypothetical protein DEF42_03780 [Desulfosporosinus sp.]|nr:hypothetical protein [Desulfosporosinus sp.]
MGKKHNDHHDKHRSKESCCNQNVNQKVEVKVESGQGNSGPPAQVLTLFSTQENNRVIIPSNGLTVPVLTLEVITTEQNQRVKLDAMIETIIQVVSPNVSTYSFDLRMDLRRSATILTDERVQGIYIRPAPNQQIEYSWHPNFTWVDVPGPPGTYSYFVDVTQIAGLNETSIVESRALTAIVFPPV